MNWKKIICWLKGHKLRVDGETIAELLTATTRTCTRCGYSEPYEMKTVIPAMLFDLFNPMPVPLSVQFPPPPKERLS